MRWLFAAILALLFVGGAGWAQPVPEPLVLFNPHGSPADMMNLWVKDAQWSNAKKRVQVIVLVHYWIVQTPLDQVRQIVEFAKKHHMTIDLSVEAIRKYPTDNCGLGEGYTFQDQLGKAARILKSLNADVSQVEIDEPLWFGTYSTDPTKCHFSVKEMTSRTALNMQEVLAVYPNILITEIEPIPAIETFPTWKQDETAFQIGFQQAVGSPIRLVQLDISWPSIGWQQSLLDMQTWLRQRNLGMGIIYNGSPLTTTDQDWIKTAIDNVETIEGTLHVLPQLVSFQTWDGRPVCNLPEASPAALTWWIDRYFRPHSTLFAQFVGAGAHGMLSTLDGKPIANAVVRGYKPGVDFSRPLPAKVLTGVVPANAVTAIIAVRLNIECNCNGLNDVLLGTIQYDETQGGNVHFTYSIPNTSQIRNGAIFGSEIVGGVPVTRIITFPGQTQLWNSSFVPVTAKAKYVFVVPAATVAGVGWYGNVNLIWVDANGNGTRLTIIPDPGKALTSTAVTAADGTYSLKVLPRTVDGPNPVTVEFDGGGGAYRSTVWTPIK
jgi:hypothetical protein